MDAFRLLICLHVCSSGVLGRRLPALPRLSAPAGLPLSAPVTSRSGALGGRIGHTGAPLADYEPLRPPPAADARARAARISGPGRREFLWPWLAGVSLATWSRLASPAAAEDQPIRVVDADDFMALETKRYLEELCRKVEAATGFKLWVIAPPQSAPPNSEQLKDYLGELKKRANIDKASVVVNVGSNMGAKVFKLAGVIRGLRVKEKLQFKFTEDQLNSVINRFATSDAVNRFSEEGQQWKGKPTPGFDKSVIKVTEHVAACMTLAARDKSTECSIVVLKDERVSEVLKSI